MTKYITIWTFHIRQGIRKFIVLSLSRTRIDTLIERLHLLLTEAYVDRLNRENNLQLQFIPQGGSGLHISGDIKNFRIHATSHLKSGTYIETTGGLRIGKHMHVGRNLTIYTVKHRFRNSSKLPYDDEIVPAPVVIGDYVWIGANVTIIGPVTIGDGAIIGAGTIIAKDVEPLGIYTGSPATKTGVRDKSHYIKLRNQSVSENDAEF